MENIPILVQPIDYPLSLDELEKCWNCGSTVFRVANEWCILKDPVDRPPVEHLGIILYCAMCGKSSVGYDFLDRETEVDEGGFDTREDAESHLRWRREKVADVPI